MSKQLPSSKPAGPGTSLACSQSSLAVQTGAGRNLQGCRFLFLPSWPSPPAWSCWWGPCWMWACPPRSWPCRCWTASWHWTLSSTGSAWASWGWRSRGSPPGCQLLSHGVQIGDVYEAAWFARRWIQLLLICVLDLRRVGQLEGEVVPVVQRWLMMQGSSLGQLQGRALEDYKED